MKTLIFCVSIIIILIYKPAYSQSSSSSNNEQALIDSLHYYAEIFLHQDPNSVLQMAEKMNVTASKHKYPFLEARTYSTIATVYYYKNDLKKASKYFSKELDILEKLNIVSEIADSYFNIATIEQSLGRHKNAFEQYKKALTASQNKKDIELELLTLERLALLTEKMERYKEAFSYYRRYINLKERRTSDEILNEILSLRTRMKEEKKQIEEVVKKKEKEIKSKTKEIKQKQLEIEEVKTISDSLSKDVIQKEGKIVGLNLTNIQKDFAIAAKQKKVEEQRRRMIQFGMGVGILIIFIILLISLIRSKVKSNKLLKIKNQEIQDQKEEIEAQRDEIETQRDYLERQNKDIKDSIHYAKKIQTALLPNLEIETEILKEYFIWFNPRDIVSGDFYWYTETPEYLVLAAADCTGHGVPGAFMSMLGLAYFDDIVNKQKQYRPDLIINDLRTGIIKSLKQQGLSNQSKDGMDVTVITIDIINKKIMFAGANNPIYVIKDDEIIEYKGDRMPVSYYLKMEPFTLHTIDIKAEMSVYLFSDGFADQFGGANDRKFKYKSFRELLYGYSSLKSDEQKSKIEQAFHDWKGEHKQVDDVMVIGLKF